MLILKSRNAVKIVVLLSALFCTTSAASAQTPTPSPTPQTNPAQRDATKPPGSEQNQTVPEAARPNTQSPQAPPGAIQTSPAAPPGANAPQQTASPAPTPLLGEVPVPEPREPVIPTFQAKPLPPPPDLSRLGVTSDNTLSLTLNEAIKDVLENNNDIEVARDDVRYAETQLRVLEGVYDPFFAITPQIDKRIAPQQSSLGGARGGTTTTTTYSLSPSVTKSFELGGGTYSLNFANQHTNTNNSFSVINPFYSSNLSLTFNQPLLRNRSIDNNRRQIRIQKKHLEQSDADFRLKTIQIINQVQQAYWELVFALRDQQNQLENLNLSRENLRNVEAQISAGAKAPLERAQVQTELATRQSALLVAIQNVSIAENNLKQLIFKDSTVPKWSAQITPTDTPSFDETPVNLQDALKAAHENRPELRRLRLQGDINNVDIQYFKNQTRPQVDLQATLAATGLAGTDVSGAPPVGTLTPLIGGNPNTVPNAFLLQQIQNIQTQAALPLAVAPLVPTQSGPAPNLIGGYGKDLSNLFGLKTRNITIGVAIQIPFKNKTAKAELAGARIQQEQLAASTRSQEQLIEVDVRNSAQAVETARKRVFSARDARTNAELQLEGEQRLYQVGRSTTFLLFQRQDELTTARAAELRAETDYNKALADLQRATSTTLHANNVTVDSPVAPD